MRDSRSVIDRDYPGFGDGVVGGADPAQQHRALMVPRGIDPVAEARIARGDDQRQRAVAVQPRAVSVHMDAVIAVIERFHPDIVELEVPEAALGNARVDP